jgi:hypothetical protein
MESYATALRPMGRSSGSALGEPVSTRASVAQSFARNCVLEETLIIDDRTEQSPAEAVEGKLLSLLRDGSLTVSQIQLRGMARGRG